MQEEKASSGSNAVSLPSGLPCPIEWRESERFLSILRVGKLVTGNREELCRIRNISAGGIMAEASFPRDIGDAVAVELRAGQRLEGHVVWTSGTTLGIRFDQSIDVGKMLAHDRSANGCEARPPRVQILCSARLRVGAKYYNVEVQDISQGGMKVAIGDMAAVGGQAVITLEHLRPFDGVIRWCREGHAGIAFNQHLPFHEMSRWLGSQPSEEAQYPQEERSAA